MSALTERVSISTPAKGINLRNLLVIVLDAITPRPAESIDTWARSERVKWYPGCGR